MFNAKDQAFPGSDDDRCCAEVDAHIKAENIRYLRAALITSHAMATGIIRYASIVQYDTSEALSWNA